jgi:hypothetical protein|tara:strand:+ start:368 stop:532 length:165 start_codon:yes stop_codon:yes gene_type:complete
MNNATYTIGSRDSIKQSFEPIGLPLMTRAQAESALAAATRKADFFELAIINTTA